MMRIETGFLRSAVARRVFWVLLVAAALPLGVFAGLAYGTLAERLDAAVQGRLQEAAKYAGLRVYDRLVSAQTALAAMAGSLPAGSSMSALPAVAREVFSAAATVEHGTGQVQGAAELIASWRVLAADPRDSTPSRRRLWWSAAPAGGQARVLLGLRHADRWWIVELAPAFLWGDLQDPDAVVSTCVTDARGLLLLCPTDTAASTPAGAEADDLRSASWSLFTQNDFGSIDWVFTRRAARAQLLFTDIPIAAVAWKAAAFSLLLVVGLSLVLIRRTTVPLERLIEGTRRLAGRDWSARVEVAGRDEFGQLAGSFNDMAGRIERQVQALQVQSGIDREILSGLDLSRVLAQVMARLQVVLPGSQVGLLLSIEGAGRWRRAASPHAPGATVAVDPDLLHRAQRGAVTLRGAEARAANRLLGLCADEQASDREPDDVQVYPAHAQGRTRALLLCVGNPLTDDDTVRELQDLCDRLAVMLVAAERERALREQAVHDSLTGLLNRSGLIDTLERRLAAHATEPFVLAFIDLDGFKIVNDTRGHPVGDALLCEVAAALRGLAPPGAAVARLGGDEFVLLLQGDKASADSLAARVCSRLGQAFVVGDDTLRIGASIGLVQGPGDAGGRVELMRRADLAMYAAKAAGRARHAWFDPALDERAAARAWLQAELPAALQRDELCLHYQPRVVAGSGALASVEALVRWLHPQRGMIPPAQFVPLAEETGQVEALGRWVLDAACRQMRQWRDAGVPVPRVSVNVSAPQLETPGFADDVLATVRRHGLLPVDLELELTESLFAGDTDQVCARLAPLRAAGVLVALDDFGTGFSSLSSLYRLPVDVLKIDRSFVIDLGQRQSADAVARTIVALAQALGKHVVAEGVETADQRARLLALGCNEMQGYLFARPLPAAAVPAWVQTEVQAELLPA